MTSADVIVTSASVCAVDVDVAVFGSGQPIAYRAGRLVLLVSIGYGRMVMIMTND